MDEKNTYERSLRKKQRFDFRITNLKIEYNNFIVN